MKEVKLKERLENVFEAFFDDEKQNENNAISIVNGSELVQNNFVSSFSEKGDFLIKVLKQVFLFFPGAFVLFGVSSALTFVPIINQYITARIDNWSVILLLYFISFLLVWFGVGDIKKLKHSIIPISVSFTGFITGIVSAVITIWFNLFPLHRNLEDYSIYFLPIALMIPFLAKGWIDKTIDE